MKDTDDPDDATDTDDADDAARQQGLLPNSVAELQVLTCAFALLDLASQGAASAKFHAHLAVSPPQMCKPIHAGASLRDFTHGNKVGKRWEMLEGELET